MIIGRLIPARCLKPEDLQALKGQLTKQEEVLQIQEEMMSKPVELEGQAEPQLQAAATGDISEESN